MLNTVNRPVPLPRRADTATAAEGAPRPQQGNAGPAGVQAGRWSTIYFDERGQRRVAADEVPVDQYGTLAAWPYRCRKDQAPRWISPATASKGVPVCEVHNLRMQRVKVPTAPLLPWRDVWRSEKGRLKAVWVGVGVAGAGAAAHSGHLPAAAPVAAAIPAAVVAQLVTRRWLVRRAAAQDPGLVAKLESGADVSDVLGKRETATIERRARMVAGCVAAGCGWASLAASAGMDPHTLGGKISLTVLAAGWLYPAATWWRWLRGQRRTAAGTAPDGPETPETDPTVDAFEVQIVSTWATRVGSQTGVLPGTKLTKFRYMKGGWSAVVESATPGAIDPDRWRSAAGRVAGAYRCGVQDVAIELDTADASRATVRVQQENPLCEKVTWPGPAATFDPAKGVSWVGRFGDAARAMYRWWNDGGPWHDLICGATGSGKSEFVNGLLLTGLNSDGLIIDRIIDPQWGQSFGDLQDHVDWFAPDITEARLLLLDTVKEMRRRNRAFSRLRQKTWRATRDMPLIVVTIDEAHEVLKDPICLALVEKLANMARKCGIKLRLITQVPVVTQLGNSTPIKDALLGGNLVVFRTGSAVSSQVSIGPALPVDPHKLPSEWPQGSPGEGQTTAGLGFMAGASRREVPWRSFYIGDDLRGWLFDADGRLSTTPGVPSMEMIAESGVLWGDRKPRIQALFDGPADDTDILPDGLVEALLVSASAKASAALRRMVAPAVKPAEGSEDGTARAEVLRTAVRWCGDDNRVEKETIAERARRNGEALKPRTLSDALSKLVADRTLVRVRNGVYEVTDKARVEVGAEAQAAVNAMIGPDPVDEESVAA